MGGILSYLFPDVDTTEQVLKDDDVDNSMRVIEDPTSTQKDPEVEAIEITDIVNLFSIDNLMI
jgi:hypothetical protein